MEGLFVTFEGTEGSGKSTQLERLANRLREAGNEVIALREPGGTALGEEVRNLLKHHPAGAGMCPETELLLMNAARAQLVREVIQPALARGSIVLCDRFHDSSIAYQVYGRGLPIRQAQRIIQFAVGETRPHLTLLLKVPLQVSEARRKARGEKQIPGQDRFEEEERGFFERVEAGYDALAGSGGMRVRTIDATQPLEGVEAEIWRWVEQLLATPMTQGEREYKSIGEYRNQGPG